jgi:hypothetical protein
LLCGLDLEINLKDLSSSDLRNIVTRSSVMSNELSYAADLIGHWPLADDTDDHARGRTTHACDVTLGETGPSGKANTAARFNGVSSVVEVTAGINLTSNPFTLSMWVNSEAKIDIVGDLLSQFDLEKRRGVNLSVATQGGMTSTTQPNRRQIQFGIDDGKQDTDWQDAGRPGNATLATALLVSKEQLYAGTVELGENDVGQVYRYDGAQRWEPIGKNPMRSNAVPTLTEFDGDLYAGVGRHMPEGSCLPPALNKRPGGKVFRIDSGGEWHDVGHPGLEGATPDDVPVVGYSTNKADDASLLTVYDGDLYCATQHRPGIYKYEGGTSWKFIGPDNRLMTLAVYHGKLYALNNSHSVPILRYEGGSDWVPVGRPEGSTQTYAAVIHQGHMHVGTWPTCEVWRYDGGEEWETLRRVGYGTEVMGMALYNGKVYAGQLPMGAVYRLDGRSFTFMSQLDDSNVGLRRVWGMAVYDGKLFASALPSGHIKSFTAGKLVSSDAVFPGGWQHIAAVRDDSRLRLYLNGRMIAWSDRSPLAQYDLNNGLPLKIGFGTHDYLNGLLSDVRVYGSACDDRQIAALAER